jgi:hypothetical protein
MKPRSPKRAERAVHDAAETVIQSRDTVIEENLWDAHDAALDGQSKQYLADIISGKVERPYKPKGGWRGRTSTGAVGSAITKVVRGYAGGSRLQSRTVVSPETAESGALLERQPPPERMSGMSRQSPGFAIAE